MIALIVFLSWSELWQKLTRPTSSPAATSRGVAQYSQQKYADATRSFAEADGIKQSPETAFNLGTAQVATGNREQGSSTLQKAMRAPSLRADAFYNRGNSALSANAFDAAIRDYSETLRLRPNDAKAKRNLEIALKQKQSMQRSGTGQEQSPQGGKTKPQQAQRAPAPGDKAQLQQRQGQTDAEALLRALQQQEQEELARMRRVQAAPTRVGW
jgi:Ca-activated chloride channel family protein